MLVQSDNMFLIIISTCWIKWACKLLSILHSGPNGKLKPTPLSQSGFWDPASIGYGQQLTVLRIEVSAYFFMFVIFAKLDVVS